MQRRPLAIRRCSCPLPGQGTADRQPRGHAGASPPAARQPRGRLTPASAWPAASPVAVANGSRLRHQAATPSPPRRTRCPNSRSAHSGQKGSRPPQPSDHQVQRSMIAHLSSASPPHSVHSTEATSEPSPLTAERGTGTGYASSARKRRADRPSAPTCGCAARSRGRPSRRQVRPCPCPGGVARAPPQQVGRGRGDRWRAAYPARRAGAQAG